MSPIQEASLFGPYTKTKGDAETWYDALSKHANDGQSVAAKFPISHLFYDCTPKETPSKGFGLFAEEDIPKGAAIITEMPSFIHGPLTEEQDARFWCGPKNISNDFAKTGFLNKFMKLSLRDQSDIMLLHNCREEKFQSMDWSPGKRPNGCTLAGKFVTNRFRISSSLTGIYFRCSFLNHSCQPNCSFQVLSDEDPVSLEYRRLIIWANRDIKAGDELTISYIPRSTLFEERQSFLFWCYGFKCVCSRCAEEKARSYPNSYDGYLFKNKQKVELKQSRSVDQFAKSQGRNIITIVQGITGESPLFPRNGIVLEEIPLMLVTKEELRIIRTDSGQPPQDYHPMITRFLQLSAEARKEFLSLHNWRVEATKTGVYAAITQDSIPPPEKLLGIWEVNRFPLDDGMEGVFSVISNLRHSCRPTCRVVWDTEKKMLNLVATETLKVGDEVTIYYDQMKMYWMPFKGRQQYLRENYGFDCHCSRCMSEARLEEFLSPSEDVSKIHSFRKLPIRLYPTPSNRAAYKLLESPSDPPSTPLGPVENNRLNESRKSHEQRKGIFNSRSPIFDESFGEEFLEGKGQDRF